MAARRAALSADTPGRIVELNVTEGSRVKKGDLVARLYADEYAAALRRAEAELVAARVQVQRADAGIGQAEAELLQASKTKEAADELIAEAEANAALAQEDFARAKDLVERGISAKSAFDAAKASLDATAAQVRTAQARQRAAVAAVAMAQARLSTARVDRDAAETDVLSRSAARDEAAATLAKTEVRAPFDGLVVLKDAEVGEVVSPNSQGGSNARGSVCTLVDLDSLEVQAEVDEANLTAVELGAPAAIFLDAYPEHRYDGRVDRIWPTANRQKGTVEVRIRFLARDDRLRPEMSARVVFERGGAADEITARAAAAAAPAILVPDTAVVQIDGRDGAFVVERDVVRFVDLELGDRAGGRVTVRRGLQAGQRIVLDPPASLRSGDRIRIENL